jgi:hypothetical protein
MQRSCALKGHKGTAPAELVRPVVEPAPLGPAVERVVLCALSRAIAKSRAKRPGDSGDACRALGLAARVGLAWRGEAGPPPFPEIPDGPWPTHGRALKRIGRTQLELQKAFRRRRSLEGPWACLPDELVAEFVPRELWPVLAHMVEEGPRRAGARAEAAIELYREKPVPATRNRSEGTPSYVAVARVRQAFAQLFGSLAELSVGEHGVESLAAWHTPPRLAKLDPAAPAAERGTPSLAEIRTAWERVEADVARRIGRRPGESDLAAVRRVGVSGLSQRGALPALRDRAAFILVVLTGSRPGAIADLRHSDLIHDHVGPGPDHRRGPVVAVRPGKTLPADLVRLKPIPSGAAAAIEAYIVALDRVADAKRRWHRDRAEHTPVPADPPLLVSDGVNYRPLGMSGLSRIFSGRRPLGEGGRARKPFVAREVAPAGIPEHDLPYIGYETRAWRHAARQLAEAAGRIWNETHPPAGGEPLPEPGLYGEALLDHKSARDQLAMRYGDWKTEAAFELLAGRAIEVMWRLLTTDEGLRRRPDVERIRATSERLEAARGHIAFERRRADRLYEEQSTVASPRLILQRPAPGDPDAELRYLEHVVAQNDRLQEAQEATVRVMSEQHRVLDNLDRMRDVEQQLLAELDSLRNDRSRWRAVPDGEPEPEISVEEEIAAIAAAPGPRPLAPPVRDWVTVPDLATLAEVGRPTVTRWLNGLVPEDPARRPWEPGRVPVDVSLGMRFRRIAVAGVNDGFWPTPATRARLAEMLAGWSPGQGWSRDGKPSGRCLEPLVGADGRSLPRLDAGDADPPFVRGEGEGV